jgi:hypothetical protein
MGKLQGTRNSHFVASKIPKLRLIFSWEKKRGGGGGGGGGLRNFKHIPQMKNTTSEK